MKRDGWSVKRLGEVCEIKSGKSIEAQLINDIEDNSLYKCYGGNGLRGYVGTYMYDGLYPIIGRVGALCGNIHLAKGKFYATEHALVVSITSSVINPYWLTYNLTHLDLRKIAKGVAQPVISAREVCGIPIPIPPLPEQSLIVEELDQLSSILEKKRQQLSDLDNLAQSIFYEMFGDPVRNEKGWEVKRLGEVAKSIFAGGDKPKDYSEVMNGIYCYPIIANGDGDKGVLGYAKSYKVGEKAVTLGARGASIGNCRICEAYFTPIVRLITIIPDVYVNIVFLYYNIKRLSFNVSGAGQAQLTVPNVVNKQTILPPLPLQQLFAQKVEAIEQEKALIKQSIKEVQELLDSRMEEYFGGS
ncbi:MAG: restriction endonuclease subunit S [Bacteroides sp.]|nr:restriction endonuclease subunit S [Bacteroides sp.]